MRESRNLSSIAMMAAIAALAALQLAPLVCWAQGFDEPVPAFDPAADQDRAIQAKASTGDQAAVAEAAKRLRRLNKAVQREGLKYARGGMFSPEEYDRVYRRYQDMANWYYSDNGPGGQALLQWVKNQSIYANILNAPAEERGRLSRVGN
jgi:hypothetical protein